MKGYVVSLGLALAGFSSMAAAGEPRIVSTCTTDELRPATGSDALPGFKVTIAFDDNAKPVVTFAGPYGRTEEEQQIIVTGNIPATATFATDLSGRYIVNLTGQKETAAGTLSFHIALPSQYVKTGSLFVENLAKRSWRGAIHCAHIGM